MAHANSTSDHLFDVARIGLPLIGGHLAQFAIGLTDTAMMGNYSVSGLAALVIGSTLFFVMFLMGSGFAWAVMPLVAAAKDETRIRRVTRMGLWLSALYALLCLPVFWFSEPIFLLLRQEPELAALAQDYLRIAGPAILPALGVMVLKSYLAALERAGVVFWITLAAALLNVALNYALIFGHWGAPELGIKGAAWASVAVQLLSLVGAVGYAVWVLPEHDLFRRLWRPDTAALKEVSRLGAPIGLTNLSEVGLFASSAVLIGWLGEIALAAHGIALQCATASFMIHLGLSNAATVRAGQAFGRGDNAHLRRGALIVIGLSLAVALMTIAVFLTLPEFFIGLFLGSDVANRGAVIATGVTLLAMAALFQLADGAQVLALGLLRGIQDTTIPMIMAAISYWPIGLSSAYLLGFTWGFGPPGVWAGLVIGLSAAGALMMTRFWRKARAH